jgi:SM-20-related protein
MMQTMPIQTGQDDPCQRIARELADNGWCVDSGFVSPVLMEQLAREAHDDWQAGEFRPAGIGRGAERVVRPEIRNDRVNWLNPARLTPAQQAYVDQLERLRQAINSLLYLGLFDFEGHLAVYPPGSYYRRHRDQFQGVGLRTVTTILYLNQDWSLEDGGQLRIYTDPDDPQVHRDILPVGGSLVTFLSAEFEHEVLPATRDRMSLTGWFRIRGEGQLP